jgi:perosamine synthetase
MNKMIQVFRPKVRSSELIPELKKIFDSGWIGLGPKVKEFEKKAEKFLNCGHFIATNGCTGALHMAVKSLGLVPKSKIITTPVTFVSTNSAILYEGHTPVFCDVEPGTGNISAESIRQTLEKYGNEIKAILVVHIGGYPCDMDSINAIAGHYGIPVIEDCAHAFGAKYKGIRIGDSKNTCCFSFQAVKNLSAGDGGGISTRNPELAERFRRMAWLGADTTTIERSRLDSKKQTYHWDYEITELGYKYHWNDVMAVIALSQWPHLAADTKRRTELVAFYKKHLDPSLVEFPSYQKDRKSSYHFYPLFFKNRDAVYQKLTQAGIFPGMHYKRNDKYPIFRKFMKLSVGKLEGVEHYTSRELTLPLHLNLTNQDLERIVKVINH